MTETIEAGRLALRVKGDSWNAYWAQPSTMEGALLLASISIKLVQNEDRKNAFITLMRECVADMLEEVTGHRPSYPNGIQDAPETEQSGGVQ